MAMVEGLITIEAKTFLAIVYYLRLFVGIKWPKSKEFVASIDRGALDIVLILIDSAKLFIGRVA